ncbi:hypothetical protein Tco_0843861 [Tanacetum coccineum]
MIVGIEESCHGPSDAMHNPIHPFEFLLNETCLICHGDTHVIYRHHTPRWLILNRSYGKAILDSNDGSTVKLGVTVNLDDKTYFDRIGSNCETIENRFSKCFNSVLLMVKKKAFDYHVGINEGDCDKKVEYQETNVGKWTGDICPNIQKRLELNKDKHRFWHVIHDGWNIFEVRNGSEVFRVDEQQRTCTCRMWQLVAFAMSSFNCCDF